MNLRKLLFGAALLWAAMLIPVHAAAVFTLQSVNVTPGSTGNIMELTMTNTGSAITVGGFSFGVSVPALSGITFSAADYNTTSAVYVFNGGNSLFGPDLLISGAGTQAILGSDSYATPLAGATVGFGATVGLAHILFDVGLATPAGPILATISRLLAESSLSDQNGGNIHIDSFVDGTITVARDSSPVPEPSSFLMLGAGLLSAAVARRRGRCR